MRKGELIINASIVLGPLLFGFSMAAGPWFAPFHIPGMLVCFALYTAGLSFLVAAKMPLFRRGVWVSFGLREMSRGARGCYQAAWALLATGAILNLALLFSTVVV